MHNEYVSVFQSLISIPSGSKLNDCQQLSFNVKREGSTSSYNENTKLLRDVLATPPSSRGNTLKTLCSLAEEAVNIIYNIEIINVDLLNIYRLQNLMEILS